MKIGFSMRLDNELLQHHAKSDPGFKNVYVRRKIAEMFASEMMDYLEIEEKCVGDETEFSARFHFVAQEEFRHAMHLLENLKLLAPSVRHTILAVQKELGAQY